MDALTGSPTAPAGLSVIPANGEPLRESPAMLVLPGGGYERHADHEAEPVAGWLASLGIHAFVLRYRVAPHRHPAPLQDAKAALAWIRTGRHGLAVNRSRVGVLGFSAGGHLAATLAAGIPSGEESLDVPGSRPDLSILCYPVLSFEAAVHQGSINNLLGASPSKEILAGLSAELTVTGDTPPAFIWHTFDDGAVDVEHSLRYALALRHAAVPAELHVYPHGRHGLGLAAGVPGVERWTELCATWLAGRGWRPA
ncbi:alpha/beta hydrolase [Arthrobacter oryzae]|uniref:alpha/beta hydrolase n=1 Tax=Arthrobacter oryzae TaxID=409290 RepID=UPI002786A5EB|nr:alpha/beta hydrolase [Arthrobacter oryzae]MDQ0076149.1 acetyl esterase/lipase [Arthrobacter oryzae]